MSRTMFLDLDGVFVDLHPKVLDLHGLEFDEPSLKPGEWYLSRNFGMSEDEMWSHYLLREAEFWADLPKTPWADHLFDMVLRYFSKDELCFLTKPLPGSGSAHGKQEWVERNYPGIPYLIGDGKLHCAGPDKFLLDDADKNIDEFNKAGGNGILFPRQWNRGGYNREPVRFVAQRLQQYG